ncbi:TPA: hypothetical protein ACG0A7_002511 [Enterobacter roggenkampii]
MMDKYAMVTDGSVVNVVEWDGTGTWNPNEAGAILCPVEVAVGWLYNGTSFTDPNVKTDAELYEKEMDGINIRYESEKSILATAFLNAGLFDGTAEQQKKADIQLKLQTLNDWYVQSIEELDNRYGE